MILFMVFAHYNKGSIGVWRDHSIMTYVELDFISQLYKTLQYNLLSTLSICERLGTLVGREGRYL